MNNGFSIYEQLNPTNSDISIIYSPTTPVTNYQYVVVKDDVVGELVRVDGNKPSEIKLTETGSYRIDVRIYDQFNNSTLVSSGIYTIDKDVPVIELKEEIIEIKRGDSYNFEENITATDKQDGDVTSSLVIKKDDNIFKSVGDKKVEYIVSDSAGNTSSAYMNVNVVNNYASIFAYSFLGIILIIGTILGLYYYRMTKMVKRFGKYGLEPINDNSLSLVDKFISQYVSFLNDIGKVLNKSVFIKRYASRYNKYLNIVNKHYKDTMNFIANKIVVSVLFLLIALISEAIKSSNINYEMLIIPLIFGFFVPDFLTAYHYYRYRSNLENDFLQAIIIMNNAFKSGRSITQAVDIVANELDGPIGLEFKKMGLELSFGLGVDVVFSRFSERVNLEEAKYLTASITILNKTGGNIIKVFTSIEKTLFNKKKLKLEMQSLTGASKIIVFALIAVPILFIVFISIINPTYFMPLITTSLGYIITSIIVIVYIIYIFVVLKIMKVRM